MMNYPGWFELGPSKVSIISLWKEKKSRNYNAIKYKSRDKVVFKMSFKTYVSDTCVKDLQ